VISAEAAAASAIEPAIAATGMNMRMAQNSRVVPEPGQACL
jgi:hypothetical protein